MPLRKMHLQNKSPVKENHLMGPNDGLQGNVLEVGPGQQRVGKQHYALVGWAEQWLSKDRAQLAQRGQGQVPRLAPIRHRWRQAEARAPHLPDFPGDTPAHLMEGEPPRSFSRAGSEEVFQVLSPSLTQLPRDRGPWPTLFKSERRCFPSRASISAPHHLSNLAEQL